jgi:hypothetical protein
MAESSIAPATLASLGALMSHAGQIVNQKLDGNIAVHAIATLFAIENAGQDRWGAVAGYSTICEGPTTL